MNTQLPRILVVDDEPDIRRLVSEILEDEGYIVAQAENASEARQLKTSEFDIKRLEQQNQVMIVPG